MSIRFFGELSCAAVFSKIFNLCRLWKIAQFLEGSLCDLYFETVQHGNDVKVQEKTLEKSSKTGKTESECNMFHERK